MTNNILLVLFQYFSDLQVSWYSVATYTFSPGLCYVFKKLQKLVLFYSFALTNGCNTCVLHFIFSHWSHLVSEMKLLLIFANSSPASWDRGAAAFALLKCTLSSVHNQQHGRGEKQAQTNKVIFLMTSSPISMNRVAAVNKEGKFPHFIYSCSKLQPEKLSLMAANAHSAPLSPKASWAGFTARHASLVAMCPYSQQSRAILVRYFSLAGFERHITKFKNEIYTMPFSVADSIVVIVLKPRNTDCTYHSLDKLNSSKYCIIVC